VTERALAYPRVSNFEWLGDFDCLCHFLPVHLISQQHKA
jgi:hypothetical protein